MSEPDWWKVKDGIASEMEIRAGDSAYGEEALAVFAAARWALEAHKQGQRVWWCEEHRSAGSDRQCDTSRLLELRDESGKRRFPCRMVERLLIPLDSEEGT